MAVRRWTAPPLVRAFSTAPAPTAKATVPLAHLASLPASLPSSHYTVTAPVQPWPHRLTMRSFSRLLLRLPTPHLAVLAFRHALFHASPPLPPSLPVFAAVLARLPGASPDLLPPVLSALRAANLPAFSDRAFLPLLRALPPLPSLRLFLSLPSFNSHPSARHLRLAAALFHAVPTKLYITPTSCPATSSSRGSLASGGHRVDIACLFVDCCRSQASQARRRRSIPSRQSIAATSGGEPCRRIRAPSTPSPEFAPSPPTPVACSTAAFLTHG